MRWICCSAAILLTTAAAGVAAAAPLVPVRLDVRGTCPDAAALTVELPTGTARADGDARAWTLRTRRERGGLRVELVDPEGTRQVWRLLAGGDCAALAQAVGAIVEGRFVELGALPAPGLPVESSDEDEPQVPEPAPAQPPPAQPAPAATMPEVAPAPAAVEGPTRIVYVPGPPQPARFGLGLGAGFAFDSIGGSGGAALGGQIDFTWVVPGNLLRLRGQLSTTTTQTLDMTMLTATQRSPVGLRLDIGVRSGADRVWVQPALGAALVVSEVTSPGAGRAMRVHPALAGSLATGIRLGAGVSLRFEIAAFAFPLTDRYVDAYGFELGRSPGLTLAASLGLDVALGSQKD